MNVNFYATLRPIVGGKTISFEVEPGQTVADLLEAVVARYPGLREHLLDEEGQLYKHVHIFVNGRDAPYLDRGLGTPLKPGDTVDFFPAVAGG